MDLVIGATGILGTEICRALRTRDRRVRAMVRPSSDANKVSALEATGVEIVHGDLREPDSISIACAGVVNVISTASALFSHGQGNTIEAVDHLGQLALVDVARAAGVRRMVYLSFPEHPLSFPLQDAKRAVEAAIRTSGVPCANLQPTMMLEVWYSPSFGFDPVHAKGRILGDGRNVMNWISVFDVREAVVAALNAPEPINATIRLGGPDAITQDALIRRFAQETGRVFECETVSLDEVEATLHSNADPATRSLAAFTLIAGRQGWRIDASEASGALGIQTTSIDAFVRRYIAG